MVTLVQGHVKAASREIVRKVKAVTIEQTVASERTEKEHSQKKSERFRVYCLEARWVCKQEEPGCSCF